MKIAGLETMVTIIEEAKFIMDCSTCRRRRGGG
jgi:hypothetical protein